MSKSYVPLWRRASNGNRGRATRRSRKLFATMAIECGAEPATLESARDDKPENQESINNPDMYERPLL